MLRHFFQLLRYSIGASDDFPEDISADEWEEIHTMAQNQALVGVMFHGIQKKGDVSIDQLLLLTWFAEAEQIKENNRQLDEATVFVTQQLEKDGFKTCVLKGQGNARLYPERGIRTPGDVDVWVRRVESLELRVESGEELGMRNEEVGVRNEREAIYRYVRKKFPDTEMLYHHLEYPILEDVMTEIHFFPMFLNNPFYNRRFQKWTWSMVADNHLVEVKNEYGSYRVPDNSFNIIYQLAHIRHHFFDEGIGLRQVVDYFFLLRTAKLGIRNEELGIRNEELGMRLRKLGLWKFAGALMWVLHEVLGLEEEYMVAEPNEKLGRMLLDEILMTGNFGQADVRFGNLKRQSRFARLFGLFKKNLKFLVHYPDDVICGLLFRAIGQPLWRLWTLMKYN